jgi:hypothetical protein
LDVLLFGGGLALGFRIDLNGGLIWWSSVGFDSRVITVGLLDFGVGSVVVDGSEGPDWLSSRDSSNKEGDSKGSLSSPITWTFSSSEDDSLSDSEST